ncbi:MAG: diaminopimelate decarboxylase [Armatimonadetes bacterium]|nr:diaminopimelate decarboxylase [Armatimonadota bacterium]
MGSWHHRIEPAEAAAVLRRAWGRSLLLRNQPSAIFHDLGLLRRRIEELTRCFPGDALHSAAIKANPVVEILRTCVAFGMGLEAASLEEVELARAAGCPPSRIVFDSPAKTLEELEEALRLGVILNADNRTELERIDRLPRGDSWIGLRINPLVGAGSIPSTSVAGSGSKFGVPLDPAVRLLFERYPWLVGVHLHVGSQGCGTDLLVEGVRRAYNLARDVPGLRFLDIGGGLPAAYSAPSEGKADIGAYAEALRAGMPELFSGGARPRLITEFGRALQANCGWAVSRVEYVKDNTAIVHLGADFLVRPVYQPQYWQHEMAVFGPDGQPRTGEPEPWSIGGPLCFQGDFIAREILLPRLEPGDWLLIRDTGAYTLALWSRFCSRGIPPVLGYQGEDVRVLRQGERPSDVVAFWS